MFNELWKNINTAMAETSERKLKSLLEQSLMVNKPLTVVCTYHFAIIIIVIFIFSFKETITVAQIKFGNTPPIFKNIVGVKPHFPDYASHSLSYNI
jgi:hypothetical protein